MGNDRLFYPGTDVGKYSRFIVDPTELLFSPNPDDQRFTQEELADLLEYFDTKIIEELSKDNEIGPGYGWLKNPDQELPDSVSG